MISTAKPASFFIGWDVGGWNCDKNALSRDAIVILDATCAIVGKPWRGNLRESIARASTTDQWLGGLFVMCAASVPKTAVQITMAIDTPLGFPADFVRLVTHAGWSEPSEMSGMNPYLFRETERFFHQRGKTPLSAIKDMIGSQATKGMHALAKFAPIVESCGVWTDRRALRAIETYPAVCRDAQRVEELLRGRRPLAHGDMDDALVCALVAYLFATERAVLEPPPESVPLSEGWIWAPRQSETAVMREEDR